MDIKPKTKTATSSPIFKLSLEAIKEYKFAYLLETGIVLADEEAQLKALEFLRLFKLAYKPIQFKGVKYGGK